MYVVVLEVVFEVGVEISRAVEVAKRQEERK